MHATNGNPTDVGADVGRQGALETDHKEWSLGRMLAVVFIICLVVWGLVFAYLLGL
jgi:hypothetical protein